MSLFGWFRPQPQPTKSKNFESKVASVLKAYCLKKYSDTRVEYKVCRNPKTGQFLPYDIYLPRFKLFVEVHGCQHYRFTPYFHRTKEDFKYLQYKDKVKKNYAKKHGHYLEIDVRNYSDNPQRSIRTLKKKIRRVRLFS